MKKIILISVVVMLGLSAFAQTSADSKKLLKKFSSSEIKGMDTETLKFNTYCADNAFEIVNFPAEKSGDSEITGSVTINDLNKINFYDLNIELLEEKYQYFKILNTDKLLIIKPISVIKTEIQ